MIIRSIHIENFGHFHDFHLDRLGFGVNPVTGENEFGKTTLLEFIRRIFWGFQVRKNGGQNPYPALSGSGLYGGRLELELADGECLTVERTGSKNGTLKLTRTTGSTEGDDAETELQKLLGAGRAFYTNVYALTLDELHALAFLDDEEIRARLYGAGIAQGNLSLPKLGATLDRHAAMLYQVRGKKNRSAELAAELAGLQDLLEEANRQLPEFEAARNRAAELRGQAAGLKQNLLTLDAAERREEQLARGAARFRVIRIRMEELSAIPEPPPGFSSDTPAEFARLAAERRRAEERLASCRARRENLERQATGLAGADSPLPAAEPALLRLEAKLDSCRRNREEVIRNRELAGVAARRSEELKRQLADVVDATGHLQKPTRADFSRVHELLRNCETSEREQMQRTAAAARRRNNLALLFFLLGAGSIGAAPFAGWFAGVGGALLLAAGIMLRTAGRGTAAPPSTAATQLEAFAESFGLKRECADTGLPQQLEQLCELLELQNEEAELRSAIHRKEDELRDFAVEFAKLPGAVGRDPETGLAVLRADLERAKVADARRKLLTEQRAALEPELAAAEREQRAAAEAAAAFLAGFGAADDRALTELAKQSEQRRELEREIAAAREALELLFENRIPQPELEHYDLEAGALRQQELAARRRECEEEQSRLTAEAGAAEAAADRLLSAGDSAALANRIEGVRGELRENAREYLILTGARRLLDRAIARYERERQPEVLRRAETLFARFTGHRYTRIRKSLTTGELMLTDALRQCEKGLGELSRGTLEELMTALRLALIDCWEEGREPLPIVLDDLFVNFDAVRHAAALTALDEFAERRQILLFSCR